MQDKRNGWEQIYALLEFDSVLIKNIDDGHGHLYLYTFPQLFKLSQASSSQLLFQPSSPLALFLVLLLSKSIKDPGLSFLAGALFFLLGLELQGSLFFQEFMSKAEAGMIVTS